MPDRDYVKAVAKAIAEGKPIGSLGRALLVEIQNERNRLQQQVIAIQNLMAIYPDKPPPVPKASVPQPSTPPPTPDLVTPTVSDGSGLTEGQKHKIMELAVGLIQQRGLKKPIDPGDLIALLESQGEHLDVQQPKSVAGVYLYRARQRVAKANGHEPGSSSRPAKAGSARRGEG